MHDVLDFSGQKDANRCGTREFSVGSHSSISPIARKFGASSMYNYWEYIDSTDQ